MNKTFYLAFSGLMLLAAGMVLFFSEQLGVRHSKILVPLFFIISGLAAMVFSNYDMLPQIARKYHIVQGFGMATFGSVVWALADSMEAFLLVTTYFVIMYGLFELVFSFGVLNSKHKINKGILMSRLVTGAINLIGGFILLLVTLKSPNSGIQIASVLITLGGLSLANFARNLRRMEL